MSASKVLKWKLVESKSGMQYHFWMFTKGGAAQLKIDAVTGERIMKNRRRRKSKDQSLQKSSLIILRMFMASSGVVEFRSISFKRVISSS